MNVLLSIKPEYADKIFTKAKRWEFRKKIWKREVEKVLVYSSSPFKKVIGEFNIAFIMHGGITDIRFKTFRFGGISDRDFNKYFEGHAVGHAIRVARPVLYDTPKDLSEFGITRPPQNFRYIEEK